MDLNRKGMVSMMDAMMFIAVLGVAASVIFVHVSVEPPETSAQDIHNDLFRTELKVSDVFEIEDTRIMPLADILGAHLTSGSGNISEYLRKVLEMNVDRAFRFICTCGGGALIIDTTDAQNTVAPRSSYSGIIETPYGPLNTSLEIF